MPRATPGSAPICGVPQCGRTTHARALCKTHYNRWLATGSTDPPGVRPERLTRDTIWQRVDITVDGCWTWLGRLHNGYGYLKQHGRDVAAMRLIYEWLVGPIPDGLDLDHLCRNRACVRPDHLEPVTRTENLRRGRQALLRLVS